MPRDEQTAAIMKGVGWLYLMNEQFHRAIVDVLALAALAFDNDACLGPPRSGAFAGFSSSMWATVKGELERGLRDSGMSVQERAEWEVALEAAYRIAGSADVTPTYDGPF